MIPKTTNNDINRSAGTGSPEMESKFFFVAAFTAVLVEIASIVFNVLLGLEIASVFVLGVSLLITGLVMLISYKLKSYVAGYTVICILLNVILLPCIFIFCGGFKSGTPVYMLMGFVFCGCHPDRKSGVMAAILAAAVYIMLFVLVLTNPGIVSQLPDDLAVKDMGFALLFGTVAILLITTLYLNSYRDMYRKNLKDYEQKTEMRMALLESQIENIEDVKRQRHNMRHHNHIIGEYAAKHDLKGLRKYLRDKQYSDEFYSKKLYCMNVEINNILTIYDRIAMNKKVEMKISSDVKSEIRIEEAALNNMISTVLENAINGAVTSGCSEKLIELEIREKGRRLVINCKNTCDPNLKSMNEYPGFPGKGIVATEESLDEIGGILDYTIENGKVICRLIVDAF